MPELRVRAGVLTGNAAVEVGAEGEGMVLGDTVNTASRLQSIAAPGTVLVDDVTRRASRRRSPTRTRARTRSRDASSRSTPGRRFASSPASAARGGARASRRRSWAAIASSSRSSNVSEESGDDAAGAPGAGRRRGRHRQVAAAVGVLQVPGRDARRSAAGIRAGACPTVRASPTGRWRRWSEPAPGSSRRRSPIARGRSCVSASTSTSQMTASDAWSSRASPICWGSSSGRAGPGGPVQRLAAVL